MKRRRHHEDIGGSDALDQPIFRLGAARPPPPQPRPQQQPQPRPQQQQLQRPSPSKRPKAAAVASKATTTLAASTSRQPPVDKLSQLREKMQHKLKGSRFRWINEQLYTTTGAEAFERFSRDPELFTVYHAGFAEQVAHWPANPVDDIIAQLDAMPPRRTVADMGCGEAKIARILGTKHTVHSFDLVAANEYITACDVSHVPLAAVSVDVVVFCLSLMGVDYMNFVREGVRILREGGTMIIAEVVSRLVDVDTFLHDLAALGLQLLEQDRSNEMFVRLSFVKQRQGSAPQKNERIPAGQKNKPLKPCVYKKR